MLDLITQIEQAAGGSVTEEIRLLKQRRKTLDQVIKFTLGISRLQKSMESVLLLKKPAKDIPRDLLKILGNISDNVANLPSNELQIRLDKIEASIRDDLERILGICENPDSLNDNIYADKVTGASKTPATDQLQELINDFRRRINTAIVLKLHLRQRGIQVEESTIPVSPEKLVQQVSRLVVEEKKCRDKTSQELNAMSQQIGSIITNEDYPENIREYAGSIQQQISMNIEHIRKGKDIEKLPFIVEIIQVGEEESKPAKPQPQNQQTQEAKVDNQKTKMGFFKKLRVWISTSWSVKWKDIN